MELSSSHRRSQRHGFTGVVFEQWYLHVTSRSCTDTTVCCQSLTGCRCW